MNGLDQEVHDLDQSPAPTQRQATVAKRSDKLSQRTFRLPKSFPGVLLLWLDVESVSGTGMRAHQESLYKFFAECTVRAFEVHAARHAKEQTNLSLYVPPPCSHSHVSYLFIEYLFTALLGLILSSGPLK